MASLAPGGHLPRRADDAAPATLRLDMLTAFRHPRRCWPRWGQAGAHLLGYLLGRLLTRPLAGLWLALTLTPLAHAAATQTVLHVAVAANFALPAQKIAAAFERESGQRVSLALGSTGKFYAQIRHGAPFAVLLAADSETPARLVREGVALAESRFTYAVGQLVLWSAQPGLVDDQGAVLGRPLPGKLALADARLAPYGAAALQVMGQIDVRHLPTMQRDSRDRKPFRFRRLDQSCQSVFHPLLSSICVDDQQVIILSAALVGGHMCQLFRLESPSIEFQRRRLMQSAESVAVLAGAFERPTPGQACAQVINHARRLSVPGVDTE